MKVHEIENMGDAMRKSGKMWAAARVYRQAQAKLSPLHPEFFKHMSRLENKILECRQAPKDS